MLQQGIQAFQNGNFDGADLILRRILQVDSKNLPALHVLGLIKASQNKYKEAADLLSKAARLSPKDASIQYNLAKALMDSGLDRESIPHHIRAVELAPNNPEAWLNYGKALSSMNSYADALLAYGNALSIEPQYAEVLMNQGATYKELKRYDEAIICADRALAINPQLAEAWANKGIALKELKFLEPAIAHFEKALHLKSDIDWVYGDLLHLKMKISSWDDFDKNLDVLVKKLQAQEKIVQPFAALSLTDDSLLHLQCVKAYAEIENSTLGPISKRAKSQKIRIGYFSADFHNHATAYLMAELFELHDKEKFELFGFSFGPPEQDEMRQRLVKSFDQFIDVSGKSDVEIAQLSRNLNVDIAVDLKGYTQDSRPKIFSYRAAPIQISWLGYPGTMGADYIDYIVADKTLIPLDSHSFYAEKVVYLPDSYQVNDRKRVVSERQFTRQELGLPEEGFVFSCLNNNYKILPVTFDAWMRILLAVDGSVLWLFEDNHLAAENLKKEAIKRGVSPGRLIFAERMQLPEHLARQSQADLFLDTYPYNAHTTASDALWVGLPILTLIGQSFASRVAASLLNAIKLPELIATTQFEYESMAIELATNPQKLAAIKQKLFNNRLTTALFDTPLFAKNIETAYTKIYERYQADLGLENILVN